MRNYVLPVILNIILLFSNQNCQAASSAAPVLPKTQILDIHTVSESPSVREQLKNIVDLTKECCQTMKKGERATLQMTAEQLKLDGYGHCGDFSWVLKNSFNKVGVLSQFASVYSSTGIIHALIEAAVYDSTQSKMLRFLCDPYVGNVYAFGFLDIIEDLSLSESYYETTPPSSAIASYMGHKLFKDLSIFTYDYSNLYYDTFVEHEVFSAPKCDVGFIKSINIDELLHIKAQELDVEPRLCRLTIIRPLTIIIDDIKYAITSSREYFIPIKTIKEQSKITLDCSDGLFFKLHLLSAKRETIPTPKFARTSGFLSFTGSSSDISEVAIYSEHLSKKEELMRITLNASYKDVNYFFPESNSGNLQTTWSSQRTEAGVEFRTTNYNKEVPYNHAPLAFLLKYTPLDKDHHFVLSITHRSLYSDSMVAFFNPKAGKYETLGALPTHGHFAQSLYGLNMEVLRFMF